MRKIMGLTAVILLFSIGMTAQEKQKVTKERQKMSSEQMATLQSKKMALSLDLNANQQKKVMAILKKQREQGEKMQKAFKEGKEKNEKPSTDKRYELMNKRLENQIQHKAAMKEVLTAEQYEKWTKMTKSKVRTVRENAQKRRQGRSLQSAGKSKQKALQQRQGRNQQRAVRAKRRVRQ